MGYEGFYVPSARYTVALLSPTLRIISGTVVPSARNDLISTILSGVSSGFRPKRVPRSLALAMPSIWRRRAISTLRLPDASWSQSLRAAKPQTSRMKPAIDSSEKNAFVAVLAEPADQPVAQARERRQNVDAEKDDDRSRDVCFALVSRR